MKWTAARQRKITCDIRSTKKIAVSSQIILPCATKPDKLAVQALSEDSNCKLCGNKQIWRIYCHHISQHDQILSVLANPLEVGLDWQMRAGLMTRMQLPTEVASTNKRPDVVIRSSSSRQVIIVDLTVSSENRIEDACQRKWGNIRNL